MLHGIMNEQGNCLGSKIRDDISEKNAIFHIFSYLTLASGALFPVIIVIADNKPMELCYRCYI